MGMTTGTYDHADAIIKVNTGLVGIKILTIVKSAIGGTTATTAYTSDAYQLYEGIDSYTLNGTKAKGLKLNGPQFEVAKICPLNEAGYRYHWEAREP
jgi:hypothetical protein